MPLSKKSARWCDKNPGWLDRTYATNYLQYGLEKAMTILLLSGSKIFPKKKSKLVGKCECGVKVKRSINQIGAPFFTCFDCKMKRLRIAGKKAKLSTRLKKNNLL